MSEIHQEGQRLFLQPWHFFLRYVLEALTDGGTHHRREVARRATELASLTDEQRALSFESGELVAEHRAGWAISALFRAGAVERPSRGLLRITDVGRKLLEDFPGPFKQADLTNLPGWNDYTPTARKGSQVSAPNSGNEFDEPAEPMERIEAALDELNQAISAELLVRLRQESPYFFEKAVLRLLTEMGYGGTERFVKHTGRSGDGGIDGILHQDALGLNRVHVQAKRYGDQNAIGRPDIQQFVGALGDRGASQGVFVTTSRFTREAEDTAERAREKIALIDGNRLVELMIRYGVGVQPKRLRPSRLSLLI